MCIGSSKGDIYDGPIGVDYSYNTIDDFLFFVQTLFDLKHYPETLLVELFSRDGARFDPNVSQEKPLAPREISFLPNQTLAFASLPSPTLIHRPMNLASPSPHSTFQTPPHSPPSSKTPARPSVCFPSDVRDQEGEREGCM